MAVRERMVGQLANVDPKIADRVAKGLGLQSKIQPVPTTVEARTDLNPSPALSILAKAKDTLEGRKIACLVADGTDARLIATLKASTEKLKANFAVIAPRIGGAITANGKLVEADFQLAGGSSVLFDAVFIALSKEGAEMLVTEAAAVAWVHDAFAHCKAIGATEEARLLLDAAGVSPDVGVLIGETAANFLAKAAEGRVWDREPKVRTIY